MEIKKTVLVRKMLHLSTLGPQIGRHGRHKPYGI